MLRATSYLFLAGAIALLAACESPADPRPGPPAAVIPPTALSGTVGTPLLVEVRVVDAQGRPVADAEVELVALPGSGVIEPATVRTDPLGVAHSVWRLDTVAGVHHGEARLAGQPESAQPLTVRAEPGAPVAISLTGPADGQMLIHPSTRAIAATVTDRYGNTIPDPQVVWHTSDAARVTVTADADARSRATITTQASLQTDSSFISATFAGLIRTRLFRVAQSHAGWTVTATPFDRAGALNNHGHVLGHIGLMVHIWRGTDTVIVGSWSTVIDLNDRGSALVHNSQPSVTAGGYTRLWRNGVERSVFTGRAADVNEADVVAGTWFQHIVRTWPQAYVWIEGQMTFIQHATYPSYPGESMPPGLTRAHRVNDLDQVLLTMPDNAGPAPEEAWRPYIWQDGTFTPVPLPPGCSTGQVVDLNNAGQVLINCPNGAYVGHGTAFTSLGALTEGHELNEGGDVVGKGSDGVYVWRGGSAQRVVGGTGWQQLRINNRGQIIVTAAASPYGSWLITPVAGGTAIR